MWRKLRIFVLLFVLVTVAQQAWLKNGQPDWHRTLYVTLYPVNADLSEASNVAIRRLNQAQLTQIEEYFAEQGKRYHLALAQPFAVHLGPVVADIPPPLPRNASMLSTMTWSLHFRWWTWRHSPSTPVKADIRLYLLYFDVAGHPTLPHSTALSKGRVGLVNVYADPGQTAQNNMVIAHELLHTVGARDKYDLNTTQPHYPEGYAEPDRQPLYPQRFAELMAGRIPDSQHGAHIPENLSQTLVGDLTAREIGWQP